VTAEVEVPAQGARGVIVAQGGRFGGWSLYAHEGRLKYFYNYFGVDHYEVEATSELHPGTHQVRMEFDYDGGGPGEGGNVALFVDGKRVGVGRVDHTVPVAFSTDETLDIGIESGSPVSSDYPAHDNRFSGRVNWVNLDARGIDEDRLVPAEIHYAAAMARQ
jgi:arylsulfatase